MVFRTLEELGHEKSVQLIDNTINPLHNIHLRGTNVFLIPQPSQDVNDPLRWPTWKKYFAFLNVCILAFMTNCFISGFSPGLYLLSIEFNLLASRIIAAFAGSSTEALGAAIVNDIFSLHERGSKMGIYILFIYCGNSVGSLLAGFIIDRAGWRWFCWFCAIISGLNFLAVFLFIHETRFNRISSDPVPSSESGNFEKGSLEEHVEKIDSSSSSGKLTGTKKTFIQDLSLWSGTSNESYFSHFLRPFLLIVYPAVAWAILSYSLCLAWQISVNSLSSFVFQEPPYNFSPGVNGLINIPAIIGNGAGAFLGGHLTDVYAHYHAMRNNGSFSPESWLVLLIFPSILVPTGLLMFGFGAQDKLHWSVLFVGYAFINAINGVANLGMTYVMDSYFEVAAESLLLVNGMKNVAGWGFTYGFIPWTESVGYATVFGAMAGIFLAVMGMAIPLYLYGERLRNYTTTKMRVIYW